MGNGERDAFRLRSFPFEASFNLVAVLPLSLVFLSLALSLTKKKISQLFLKTQHTHTLSHRSKDDPNLPIEAFARIMPKAEALAAREERAAKGTGGGQEKLPPCQVKGAPKVKKKKSNKVFLALIFLLLLLSHRSHLTPLSKQNKNSTTKPTSLSLSLSLNPQVDGHGDLWSHGDGYCKGTVGVRNNERVGLCSDHAKGGDIFLLWVPNARASPFLPSEGWYLVRYCTQRSHLRWLGAYNRAEPNALELQKK